MFTLNGNRMYGSVISSKESYSANNYYGQRIVEQSSCGFLQMNFADFLVSVKLQYVCVGGVHAADCIGLSSWRGIDLLEAEAASTYGSLGAAASSRTVHHTVP